MSNKIIYYPYIDLPNGIWTINSILYWDEIVTIYPEIINNYYDELDDLTTELLQTGLLTPVRPSEYNYDKSLFINNIISIVQNETFKIETKRELFQEGNYIDCFSEKFEEDLYLSLEELKLAQRINEDKFCVENHTANLLILMLATEIGRIGGFTPSTDDEHYLDSNFFSTVTNLNGYSLRNEILNEILPCPTNVHINDLIKFKGKHDRDLCSFRQKIELLVETLSAIKKPEEREELKRKNIKELKKEVEFITAKMKESKLQKVLKGSWISVLVSGTTSIITGNPLALVGGAASATLGSAKNFIIDSTKGSSYRYVGLIEKHFK